MPFVSVVCVFFMRIAVVEKKRADFRVLGGPRLVEQRPTDAASEECFFWEREKKEGGQGPFWMVAKRPPKPHPDGNTIWPKVRGGSQGVAPPGI